MAPIIFDPSQISSYKYAQECYQMYKTDNSSVVGYDEELMESMWKTCFSQWDLKISTQDVNK